MPNKFRKPKNVGPKNFATKNPDKNLKKEKKYMAEYKEIDSENIF
jgi:hypothetical protein